MAEIKGEITQNQTIGGAISGDEKLSALILQAGPPGKNGLSAYEIAVKNGYVGTEQEWLQIHLQRNELEIVTKEEAKQDFNRINNGEINETVV